MALAKVSVVIPVFNGSKNLQELVVRITTAVNSDCEILMIDDGSNDGSWSQISALAHTYPQVHGARLSKNVGQHAALLAGVREARCPIIATLDDDLQNPPEELVRLLEALTADVDVVYGVPVKIEQPIWRSFFSVSAKRVMQKTLGLNNAVDISSFRVFRSHLRDGFNGDLGPGVSIDALLSWSTSRFTSVRVQHHARKAGKSNYNFWKLLRFMVDTVTGFSTVPLRIATGLGLATIALSVGVLLWVLGRPLITGESVPGFPFLAATIAIFSGTQLLVLGVIGQYIGRMHFRIMNKPTYTIVERTIN
jgi:glycosyltransferase involved in cell wall biosynthesis